MAELNSSSTERNSGRKIRSKKQAVKVDLTAMVDLAFLLITFFMLTTTLAKQNAMPVDMPVGEQHQGVTEDRTMTILLGDNNKIEWYFGTFENPIIKPTLVGYGENEVRAAIITQSKRILSETKDISKGLIVIIKPSIKSNYKNLIDILDEMNITKMSKYAIADITPGEIDLLKQDKIY